MWRIRLADFGEFTIAAARRVASVRSSSRSDFRKHVDQPTVGLLSFNVHRPSLRRC
jgi:hypothetical protein